MVEGSETRAERLAAVREQALSCTRCRLWERRRQVVFGEGNPDARMMVVGEGPGEVEDRTGRPFQGPAGQLFDRALAKAGIDRALLWVTNTVKSRAADPVGRRLKNRPPRMDEIDACRPWLDAEIDIIRPRVIVCLGASAAKGLIDRKFKIGEQRSQWFPGPHGSAVLATYHPSYPLRLQGEAFERVFGIIVEDLARAWERAVGAES